MESSHHVRKRRRKGDGGRSAEKIDIEGDVKPSVAKAASPFRRRLDAGADGGGGTTRQAALTTSMSVQASASAGKNTPLPLPLPLPLPPPNSPTPTTRDNPQLPASPQPPRVTTAQDRKRAILARKGSVGGSTKIGGTRGSQLLLDSRRTNSFGGGGGGSYVFGADDGRGDIDRDAGTKKEKRPLAKSSDARRVMGRCRSLPPPVASASDSTARNDGGRDLFEKHSAESREIGSRSIASAAVDGGVAAEQSSDFDINVAASRDASTTETEVAMYHSRPFYSRSGSRSLFGRPARKGLGESQQPRSSHCRTRKPLSPSEPKRSKLATLEESSSAFSAVARDRDDGEKGRGGNAKDLSPTLFGAVMSRSSGTPNPPRSRPSTSGEADDAERRPGTPAMPYATKYGVDPSSMAEAATTTTTTTYPENDHSRSSATFDPKSTPLRLSPGGASPSASNISARSLSRSPGGIKMQEMLECVTTSFHWRRREDRSELRGERGEEEFDGEKEQRGEEDGGGTVEAGKGRGDSVEQSGDNADQSGWYETYIALPMEVEARNYFGGGGDDVHAASRRTASSSLVEPIAPQTMRLEPVADVGLVDWSVKKRLRIDLQPGRCLPGSFGRDSALGYQDEWRVEHLARKMFLNFAGRSRRRSFSDEIKGGGGDDDDDDVGSGFGIGSDLAAAARWRAATMYWQHPEVYPLPPDNLSDGVGQRIASGAAGGGGGAVFSRGGSTSGLGPSIAPLRHRTLSDTTGISPSDATPAERQARYIRDARAAAIRRIRSAAGFGGGGGLCGNVQGSRKTEENVVAAAARFAERRRSEWRGAFRDLFMTWLRRIDEVRERTLSDGAGREASVAVGVGEAGRCYFYSVSSGQTVLFRADCGSERGSVLPMIVLSSTTAELRSALRSLGVRLFLLDRGEGENTVFDKEAACPREFCENQLDKSMKPDHAGLSDEEEAASAREELEALRRATAHGEIVGAEISVDVAYGKKKRAGVEGGRNSAEEYLVTPLYLYGDEDCMAFFELYFNSCGGTQLLSTHFDTSNLSTAPDVPLLLSRMPESIRHMSLRTLTVGQKRDDYHSKLQRHKDSGADTDSDTVTDHDADQSFIEMIGPILPCAVREMLIAAASLLMLDKRKEESTTDHATWDCEEKKDDCSNTNSRESAATDVMVGSHFFVSVCEVQDGSAIGYVDQSTPSLVKGAKTGTPSSAYFNSGWRDLSGCGSESDVTSASVYSCSHGEVFKLAVWNLNSPCRLSLKTEPVAPLHPI